MPQAGLDKNPLCHEQDGKDDDPINGDNPARDLSWGYLPDSFRRSSPQMLKITKICHYTDQIR